MNCGQSSIRVKTWGRGTSKLNADIEESEAISQDIILNFCRKNDIFCRKTQETFVAMKVSYVFYITFAALLGTTNLLD